MSIIVVTPPAPLFDLEAGKAQVRVDGSAEDELIEECIAAACEEIDGPAGELRISIGLQTLRLQLEGFPRRPIYLPAPPVVSIDAITYVGPNGSEATVDPSTYELSDAGRLRLVTGCSWPAARSASDFVNVKYQAGSEEPPANQVRIAKMLFADFFANRGEPIPNALSANPTIARMVRRLRIPRV